MGDILVGTASWTDKSLVESGLFYPAEAKTAEARLQFYASLFPLVEVDSSYYALPSERNAALWVTRTPPGFVFDIKAFRAFTAHQTPLEALPRDIRQALPPQEPAKKNVYYSALAAEVRQELWQRFERALLPLQSAGKLGVILFQFPPWFVRSRQNMAHILECADRLDTYDLAVEFRHQSWLLGSAARETLAFLRENGLAYVVVDEPQGFKSSVPPVWEAAHPDLAVVRLHGRNIDTWERKDLPSSAERFNYLYGQDELGDIGQNIHRLAEKVGQVHVIFNNCYRDYAVRNARQMAGLLGATREPSSPPQPKLL